MQETRERRDIILAKAAVLCGKNAIQVRELESSPVGDGELPVKNISSSIYLSTYKTALLREDHKRVPDNISERPPVISHEFTGIIMEIGNHPKDRFQPGEKLVLQSVAGLPGGYSAGYGYEYSGGNTTYCVIPKIAIDLGCVLPYRGNYSADASLNEPISCIIGVYHVIYHTKWYVCEHLMDVKEQGKLALIGCAGPIGIGTIDYTVNESVSSKLIVAVDIGEQRLEHARTLIPEEVTKKQGKTLIYINTRDIDAVSELRKLSRGAGFDDVFIFVAVPVLLKQTGAVLGDNGCLNFLAGPIDKQFAVPFGFYSVHYEETRIAGTSGGSTQDILECLMLSAEDRLDLSYMITCIGGLQVAPKTILNLPNISGGKKLIYPHIDLSLTVVENSHSRQSENPLFKTLADICEGNHNVWREGTETYLLEYYQI